MSMLVVVTENVPPRLRGGWPSGYWKFELVCMLVMFPAKIREMIWQQVSVLADEGNVVMAWATNTESGFEFQTFGENRRIPVNLDGLRLVSFLPVENQ